jgi:hypothetical protein
MVAAGHQRWERGDLVAVELSAPAEARQIADRIQHLRGVPFKDGSDSAPLVEELRRRDIPFVVKGMNRLFDSPEIVAVLGICGTRHPGSRPRCGDECVKGWSDGNRPASAVVTAAHSLSRAAIQAPGSSSSMSRVE